MNNDKRIRDIKITTRTEVMHRYYIFSVVEQKIVDTIMLTEQQAEQLNSVNMRFGTIKFIRKEDNDG